MSALRIAVVGAGHMGRLHAEKVSALGNGGAEVALAGVADADAARARALADELGVPATGRFGELLGESDAVIVAVPTVDHHPVVREVLAAGCDVLVEKPIAVDLGEADDLLKLAHEGGRILQVGHLEWYNPAMQVIRERIQRPRFVEAHRLGPFPDRATDIDVVRDLMIHDLDIIQQILGEEPVRVEAIGVSVLSESVDIANARVTYPGGCVANLTASRVTPTPMRKLRFFQTDGYFSIDFLEQSALVLRRRTGDGESGGDAREIQVETLDVNPADAMEAQLRSFLRSVRTREPSPANGPGSPGGACGALRTALRVIDAMPAADQLA